MKNYYAFWSQPDGTPAPLFVGAFPTDTEAVDIAKDATSELGGKLISILDQNQFNDILEGMTILKQTTQDLYGSGSILRERRIGFGA